MNRINTNTLNNIKYFDTLSFKRNLINDNRKENGIIMYERRKHDIIYSPMGILNNEYSENAFDLKSVST